ncbi:hypothetical protein R6Q59_027239 [Mikania micrantha]
MEDVNDLEMQMLVASPRAENHAGGGSSAIQMLKTAILVVQSLQMFLAGTNHGSSPEQDENVSLSLPNPIYNVILLYFCENTDTIFFNLFSLLYTEDIIPRREAYIYISFNNQIDIIIYRLEMKILKRSLLMLPLQIKLSHCLGK